MRPYAIFACLALATFGYAQYRAWTPFPGDGQELRRQAASSSTARTSSGGGFRGGSTSSGHK